MAGKPGRSQTRADPDFQCSRCARPFTEADYQASITARIMGDDCTDVYYWCEACGVYTIRLIREIFAGPDVASSSKPIDKQEGDRRLALIRACTEPYEGRCRCEAHRAYFDGWLD